MSSATTLDKSAVLEALRARLQRDASVAAQAQQRTQSGATHEENRPENDKDTRAIEASYLARGQAQRVVELEGALRLLAVLELRALSEGAGAVLGALVELTDGERESTCFLAPAGGGLELQLGASRVKVVTPQSPLGRALLGRHAGDSVEVSTPQGLREFELLSVV